MPTTHLAVPMFYDPMFWYRVTFASAVSTVVLLAAIIWFAKQTIRIEQETTVIKRKILEKINHV